MSRSESEVLNLRARIRSLTDRQQESLLSATFVGMSEEEGKEFDARQIEILELVCRLADVENKQ